MNDEATATFAEHRDHLLRVAYRLTGTLDDAEDAVQETWLRWERTDRAAVRDARGWLTTVVGRICLDQLKSARAQRERYVGPWLPEPLVDAVGGGADPADRVTLDESVSLAMLAVLESLSPAERTAFVLHDVFGMSFEEVASAVGRTPAACRQLASRARRHLAEHAPRTVADRREHAEAVTAFAHAANSGDVDGLLRILDPQVVWRADGGGLAPAARRVLAGAEQIVKIILSFARDQRIVPIPAVVNGALGYVMERDGTPVAVIGFVVADGRIREIDVVANPEKLRRLAGG